MLEGCTIVIIVLYLLLAAYGPWLANNRWSFIVKSEKSENVKIRNKIDAYWKISVKC